jgi:hypothetical protein
MPNETLANYLISLSEDPNKLQSLKQDPDAALNEAGLNEEEKAIVMSSDPAKIRAAITGSDIIAESNVTVVVVVVVVL